MSGLDLEHLRGWIGRTETASDTITPRMTREFSVATGGSDAARAPGETAPLGIHWCLAPHIVAAGDLGPDGHPARGGFLPPVALPRRMWAGSSLVFTDGLRVGDTVQRHSRIHDVAAKQGRTGALCFVTVEHTLSTARGTAIVERHDIVYRDQPGAAAPPPAAAPKPDGRWQRARHADPVMLFRYSAVTFIGHRIHYDREYAIGVEGYPGLVVHGPLQATLLLHFAEEIRGVPPRRFVFRGLQPLFDFQPFATHADADGEGLSLETRAAQGTTMSAQAGW